MGGRKKRWGRGQESSVAERSTFPQGNKEKIRNKWEMIGCGLASLGADAIQVSGGNWDDGDGDGDGKMGSSD